MMLRIKSFNMKKFFLFLFLIGIVCLGGYIIKTQSTRKLVVTPSTTTTIIPTDKVDIDDEIIKEQKDNYSIDVVYPKTNNLVINEIIKNLIQEKVDKFKEAAIEPSPNSATMTLIISYNVILNQENILSLRFASEDYTGGAHPSHLIFTKNFNLETNEEIAFNEIITSVDALEDLSKFALEYFKNKKLEFKLFEEGLDPKEENYKTFCLSKDSVNFYFNEYQIAPYYAGNFELQVPYEVLGFQTESSE